MKPFPFPLTRRCAVAVTAGFCLLLVLVGCGRHVNSRPASSLSPADQTTLAQYEQIRAALAADDLKTAKASAGAMAISLKTTDPRTPEAAALGPASDLAAAPAIDRARQKFKALSATIIPLADGVEGYCVMTCPMPSAGDWVQRNAQPENPYFGSAMRGVGELKK